MYVPSSRMRPQWVMLDFDARLRSPGIRKHRVLGRKLVSFRDADRELHIADEACPHRGASLAEGRVEGAGVVCPYHLQPCSEKSHPARFYEYMALQGFVWMDVASNVITQHFMPPYYPELGSADYEVHRSSALIHANPVVLMESLIDRRGDGSCIVSQAGPYGRERYEHGTDAGKVTVDVEYAVPFTCNRRYQADGRVVLLTVLSILPVSRGTCTLHAVTARLKGASRQVADAVDALEALHHPRVSAVMTVDPDAWPSNALGPGDDFVRGYRDAMALFFPEMLRFCVA